MTGRLRQLIARAPQCRSVRRNTRDLESVIFNCTGHGATALFHDTELTPTEGQLIYLPPGPAVDYMCFGGGRGMLYMFPRSDVILLGGTFKLGDYSTQPEPDETERIVLEHQQMFARFDA